MNVNVCVVPLTVNENALEVVFDNASITPFVM